MSHSSIEAYGVHRFTRGIREAWTALEHRESVDGLRDRLTTLERQLGAITPTLETQGHRELLRDLSAAVERVDEGSGVHVMPIEERRYDLGEVNDDGWPPNTIGLLRDLVEWWGPTVRFHQVESRYTRTTDECGITCWVRRES